MEKEQEKLIKAVNAELEEWLCSGDTDYLYKAMAVIRAEIDKRTYTTQYSGKYEKELLLDIICGKAEIVKLPWKPKQDETFYTFGIHATENKWVVVSVKWWDNVKNLALYKIGWIYRSQAEAEAALPAVATEMGVRYEL